MTGFPLRPCYALLLLSIVAGGCAAGDPTAERRDLESALAPRPLDLGSAPLAEGGAGPEADPDIDVALPDAGTAVGPVALCSVDLAVGTRHAETPTWRGDASFDPSGGVISTYRWTLTDQPEGSVAELPDGAANLEDFVWDLAGTYVAELVVANEEGEESAPCSATFMAVPADDLWVEMFWTHDSDDMDLHVVAPGGSPDSFTSDCYFANCTGAGLDWGIRGESVDNPSLDLDDIPGTGPENTRIGTPADGTYTVVVHDYPTSVYSGLNTVTVNIYVGGALAWTDTRDIDGEDEYEDFATVSFPDGTVTTD